MRLPRLPRLPRLSASLVVAALSMTALACTSARPDAPSSADSNLASADLPKRDDGTCGGAPCAPAPLLDGTKDGSETDVDCGGPTAPKCTDGKTCGVAGDCTSGVCTDTKCIPPSSTDGVKNGAETDIDCGGPDAPKCDARRTCTTASDCASDACSATGVCQVARSCTGKLGAGDNCGPGLNDSCCASARVPATGDAVTYSVPAWNLTARVSPYRLDKYEVTVGRLRAFFEDMGGNPQAAFPSKYPDGSGAHPSVPGSGWKNTWNKRLPASWADIASRYGDPADAAGGSQYCMRGQGGDYGTTTYKKVPDANGNLVDNFEVKPVVCLDWYTLFAFCTWDGGRLPTSSEWGLAAGDDQGYTYSWGNTAPDASKEITALAGFVPYPDFTWGVPYRQPFDRGTHISPVGQKSSARFGQYDLSGNVAEWLLDAKVPHGSCDNCADISQWSDPTLAWPDYEPTLGAGNPTWKDGGYRVARGGTWEGHDTRNIEGTWDGIEVGFTYHALGGRCARDL